MVAILIVEIFIVEIFIKIKNVVEILLRTLWDSMDFMEGVRKNNDVLL